MNNMDRLEVRVPDEIKDYKEKYAGFTVRQWIGIVLAIAVCIPIYLLLYNKTVQILAALGTIICAAPIALIFFIPINGLPAEKMVPYFRRSVITFGRVLSFQTEAERKVEEELQKDKKYRKSMKKLQKEERKNQLKIERGKASEENAKVKELRASVDAYYNQLRKEKIEELSSSFNNLSKKEQKKLKKERQKSKSKKRKGEVYEKLDEEEVQKLEKEIETEKELYLKVEQEQSAEENQNLQEGFNPDFIKSNEMEDSALSENGLETLPVQDSEVADGDDFTQEHGSLKEKLHSDEDSDFTTDRSQKEQEVTEETLAETEKQEEKLNSNHFNQSQVSVKKKKKPNKKSYYSSSNQKKRSNPNRPNSKSKKGYRQSDSKYHTSKRSKKQSGA